MAGSLKTIKERAIQIVENESKRLFERKKKYELGKHLKHVETRLEI